MAFTGTGLVEEVSDSVVRITGLSLVPGAVGTIGLHNTLIPFHGLVPDVRLPAEFQPDNYATVTLQASIQSWFNLVFSGAASVVVPISLAKSGTTQSDFLIAVSNMSGNGAAGFIGAAFPFSVLAATAVNNSNVTGISGDVGVWPGAVVTGFPPGTATGTIHIADATAQAAVRDATVGYVTLAAMTPTQNLSGQDLGGLVLGPGIYRFDADATLTGTLTLDFQNDLNAIFVIQVVGNLTTAAASVITMITSECGRAAHARAIAGRRSVPPPP